MAIRVPLDAHDPGDGADGHGIGANVAFSELWQHRAALRDICQRIVGDAATADDVVQETYLRALDNLDRLERRPTLMPWLATVARRRSIDELRRRQYQRPVDAMPDESTRPELDPGEAAGVSETVARVREALTALTDRERELLMRQVNQGLSLSELAALDNSSVASVRSVLSRARTKLRDALVDSGARILIPIAGFRSDVREWFRSKVGSRAGAVAAKAQRVVSPMLPGGVERVAETATAAVTAAVIALGGLVPAAGASAGAAAPGPEGVTISDAVQTGAVGPDTGTSLDSGGLALGGASDRHAAVAADPTEVQISAAADAPRQEAHGSDAGSGGTQSGDEGGLPPTPAPPPPSTPPPPDNPLNEPDPKSPSETDVKSMSSSSTADGSDPTIVALGQSACQGLPCRVVWESTDGGQTWSKEQVQGLDGTTLMATPKYLDGDDRLYSMSDAGLQYSTDHGRNWQTAVGPTFDGSATITPNFSPEGEQRIFLGAAPTWSYDAGTDLATPVPLEGLPANATNFDFAPSYPDTRVVFAGTIDLDGNPVVYTCGTDCEDDPVILSALSDLPELHVSSDFDDDETVVAWAGRDMYVSRDAGSTFDLVDLPDAGRIVDIDDDGSGNFFVGTASPGTSASALFRTRDFESFTAVGAASGIADGLDSLLAVRSDLIFVGPVSDAGGGLLCSTNGGASWKPKCS